MPVIIIPKNKPNMQFPTIKEAKAYLRALGKDINNYEIKYVYDRMARSKYPPSYVNLHRKAALAYYYRNKDAIREQKRQQYKENKTDGKEF